MIGSLREHYKITELCRVFNIPRSTYNYRVKQSNAVNPERERLKAKLFAYAKMLRGYKLIEL